MRPRQWPKNLLVLAAFLFSVNEAWEPNDASSWLPLLGRASAAFAIFCLVAGADYLINDVRDAEADRLHPRKRLRPIAAGQLDPGLALVAAATFVAIGVAASFVLEARFGLVVVSYLALMLAYSFVLKRVVILDLLIIAVGFLLRAMAGAFVIDVSISPWLYLLTLLAALFLAIYKRRGEIATLQEEGSAANHRAVLEEYPQGLLDQMVAVVSSATIMAYSIYVIEAENLPSNHAMVFTVPFVLYGIFRYQYLVHRKGAGDSPEEIFTQDIPLIMDILMWMVTVAVVLFVFRD
jgi:4-hydroxybenzoate polyprenyltransferase